MPSRRGDPEGRRLHRWRAQRLSEAGRLARAVEGLLRRAEFGDFDFDRLIDDIGIAERRALEAAHGHIEPRQRFQGGLSQPLTGRGDRDFLYVDESGQSWPDTVGTQPHFALAGISLSREARDAYTSGSAEVKREFGIPIGKPFHEPAMRFREGIWGFGGDKVKQFEFDAAVASLIDRTPFVVFGVAIRKAAFTEFLDVKTDPYLPTDMYAVAIHLLLERYVDYLAMTHPLKPLGRATFESIGSVEDARHAREYISILIDGTQWIGGAGFRQWLETGARFAPKTADPMELADMFARDLQEWVRLGCVGEPGRWRTFSSRIHCRGDGRMGKFGVKVFPDSDIREAIDVHRRGCGAIDPE